MGTTPNYGFITTPATDSTKRFIDWRVELTGDDPESTLMKIDTILADINEKAGGIDGFYGVKIDENGDLILTYSSDDPPPLSIDDNGDLVYLLDSDTVVNLGHVIGKDGKGPYEIAVEQGYTGSEAEFYAALVALKDSPFLPLSGGAVTGDVTFDSISFAIFKDASSDKKDVGLCARPDGLIVATPDSVDAAEPHLANISAAAPTNDTHLANKGYVDGLIGEINNVLDVINGEVM